MVRDDLRHPEGRLEPVEDRVAVTHDPRRRLDGPEARSASAHAPSARLFPFTIPASIACPIAKGIRAWATIQTTPKKTPATSVGTWWRPTQSRSRRASDSVRYARVLFGQADDAGPAARASTVAEEAWSMRLAGFLPPPDRSQSLERRSGPESAREKAGDGPLFGMPIRPRRVPARWPHSPRGRTAPHAYAGRCRRSPLRRRRRARRGGRLPGNHL